MPRVQESTSKFRLFQLPVIAMGDMSVIVITGADNRAAKIEENLIVLLNRREVVILVAKGKQILQ